MDSQPEFTKAVWDYLDVLVNDDRVAKGRELLAKHRATFDAVERAYGVDRYIIAAIWGVETNYGTLGGDRPVLRSTATLACVGRRQRYFRDEFIAALDILNRGDVRENRLVGSWAGAFGPTQFMPTAFKRYAVDFDNDGHRDVIDSMADLIASTANNLKKAGWASGQTWGYEVGDPGELQFPARRPASRHDDCRLAAPRHRASRWQAVSARRRPGLSAGAGRRAGPGLSDAAELQGDHALQPGRGLCAGDRPSGRPTARRRGPSRRPGRVHERVLSRAERLELQHLLERHGFDVGEPDGRLGLKTRDAIRDFQARIGQVPDGFASAAMLERLRRR